MPNKSPSGRLPSRSRQRHRGDHRAAGALRRPAGHPDHRRPLAGDTRAGPRRGHPGVAQADQAGRAARAAGTMAGAARGGGGVAGAIEFDSVRLNQIAS